MHYICQWWGTFLPMFLRTHRRHSETKSNALRRNPTQLYGPRKFSTVVARLRCPAVPPWATVSSSRFRLSALFGTQTAPFSRQRPFSSGAPSDYLGNTPLRACESALRVNQSASATVAFGTLDPEVKKVALKSRGLLEGTYVAPHPSCHDIWERFQLPGNKFNWVSESTQDQGPANYIQNLMTSQRRLQNGWVEREKKFLWSVKVETWLSLAKM